MIPKMVIRSETEADVSAISEVTVAAFRTLEISNHTEQFIIAALRAARALTISLVAEVAGRVIGHIAFSPVVVSDGTQGWYGLGPVSVLPAYQRRGIGKALIQEGLSRLKAMNAQGCCLVGHPDYYRKFGFKNISGLVHEGVPPEVFFALSFEGRYPEGKVIFHDGFKADGTQDNMTTDAQVDNAVLAYLATTNGRRRKVAMVFGRVTAALGAEFPQGQAGYELFDRRMEALVRDGRLVAQGDITRWRHSEVRLPRFAAQPERGHESPFASGGGLALA